VLFIVDHDDEATTGVYLQPPVARQATDLTACAGGLEESVKPHRRILDSIRSAEISAGFDQRLADICGIVAGTQTAEDRVLLDRSRLG